MTAHSERDGPILQFFVNGYQKRLTERPSAFFSCSIANFFHEIFLIKFPPMRTPSFTMKKAFGSSARTVS